MNTQFHNSSFDGVGLYDMPAQSVQQNLTRRMQSLDQPLEQYQSLDVQNDDDYTALGLPQTMAARKQMTDDISEPPKPNSPYALFFRDTVNAIKNQNPNCSYEEIANIVSSMWEALDSEHKNVYFKKTEHAQSEYLVRMRAYRDQIREIERQAALEQQQLQQQQQQMQQHHPLQTKPAVFMIPPMARTDSSGNAIADSSMNSYNPYNANEMLSTHQMQQHHHQQQLPQSVIDLSNQQLHTKPAVFTIPHTNENHYVNYSSSLMLPSHMQQLQPQQQHHNHNQHQQNQYDFLSTHAMPHHQGQHHQHQQPPHHHYQRNMQMNQPTTQFLPQSDVYGESTPAEIEQRRLFMEPLKMEQPEHEQQQQPQQQQQQQQLDMQFQDQQQQQQQQHREQYETSSGLDRYKQQQDHQQLLQQQAYELDHQRQQSSQYQQEHQQLAHPQSVEQQRYDISVTTTTAEDGNTATAQPTTTETTEAATMASTAPSATPSVVDQTSTLQVPTMLAASVDPPQKCIREGCNNLGIVNADWENEYCSNECVVAHCRNVFQQWVKENMAESAAQQKLQVSH